MSYRSDVVKAAKSQIGACEPSGDDVYLKWFNQVAGSSLPMNAAWCACFVSWCLRKASVPTSVFGNFAQCSVALSWAKSKKIFYYRNTGHRPSPGDLILFDWNGDNKPDHIGIVESTTVNSVKTIEGNTKGGAAVDGVREKIYSSTSKSIYGYICLQYDDTVDSKPKATIKDVQSYLVKTYKVSISIDGIFGPLSKKALIRSIQTEINNQTQSKLVVDGIWGAKSKTAFPDVSFRDRGKMVYLVQSCLLVKGYDIELDGVFGNDTLSAVRSFQTKSSIKCDGVVGKDTITNLLK